MNTERPLDGIRSIKAKLALLVGASIVAASLVSEVGDRAGVPVWLTVPVTVAAALGVTQWLARGMTSPLREMTDAAASMATGDYSRRVTATSADEVGALARAFNTMAGDLATADQQRRQLVATVSHELRTPLAAQQALLENLVDGVVRPDDAALRTALRQAERLGDLVGDLLDLSRVDGGRSPLTLAPVRVSDLVARAVAEADVSPVRERRRVTHRVVVEPADLEVTADPGRLSQVLANLLDNADRHSPVGGTVTVAARLDGVDRWSLEVADEGPGIAPEHAQRVFDRFGSGDDSGGGTGIGLAIASWVCELHGGSIAALPAGPGRPGARVRAVLPMHPVTVTRPLRPAPPAPIPRPPAPNALTKEPTMPSSPVPPSPSPAGATGGGMPATAGASAPVPSLAQRPTSPPRPLIESVFGDLWPEAGLPPQIPVLLGSVAVGVLAAAVLPENRFGLNLLLVLLTGGALVWRVSVRRSTRWSLLTAVLCLGLTSLVVLRAAEWVTVLSVLFGILLTTTALTDARKLLPMVAAAASWPLSALRGLPLLGRTISATSKVSVLWPVVRTVALSLVALVVFGGLFASGDAVFGSWANAVIPSFAWDSLVARFFVAFVVGGSLLAACYLALNPAKVERLALPVGRPVARLWEWVVPVGIVVALFVAFVVAQAAALFGGHDYVQRTTGLTYAEYVHQGFGQLTVATLLTLLTVAIAVRKARQETPRDRLVLRSVVGALCALTLVVVASALHRMDLYQQAYGFTVLRVLVVAFELWLGLLVVLVMVAGIRLRGWWLPRAALVAAASFLLVGGLANPEGWVAQRNIERFEATGKLDVEYLHSLGADAAPAISAGLPADVASCVLHSGSAPEAPGVVDWNLGRARAASAVSGLPVSFDPVECTTWLHVGYTR